MINISNNTTFVSLPNCNSRDKIINTYKNHGVLRLLSKSKLY